MSTSPVNTEQGKVGFEQYKLAVEMAAGLSARRQAANKFFIGLVSGFGILQSLIGDSTHEPILLILPICFCGVWWLTIYSHRRINKAKWRAIYRLEKMLPHRPFTFEKRALAGKQLMLTRFELAIPLIIGLVLLLLASRDLLRWVRQ